MLLAIDTSTSDATIGLVRDGHLLAELRWDVGRRHSTELLQRLEWLVATCGTSLDALTAVAVATGPGSFNGVRVAVTTAKMLGLSLGVPLYGVPTLDVIAWGSAQAAGPVWALLEAGRGQVYAAEFATPAASAAMFTPLSGYIILTPDELAERVREPVLFCGEWRDETRSALRAALGDRARFQSPLLGRHAVWLAELALARAAEGHVDDPEAIEPLYLRRPAITSSKKLARHVGERASAGPASGEPGGEEAARALRR